MLRSDLLFYAVTDSSGGETLYRKLEEMLPYITILQLRDKTLSGDALINEAQVIKEMCHKKNIPFIINDNVYLAKKISADGVHLGQSDMKPSDARLILGNKIIGVTCKTPSQAILAEKEGASYIGSGAVFGSLTKKEAIPLPISVLKEITASVSIPVVAIGGINKENVIELKDSGIAGACFLSSLFGSDDIRSYSRDLRRILKTVIK